MTPGAIVIVNLASPTERVVGQLLSVGPAGITVRGIDLNALEDWIANVRDQDELGVRPATVFFPLHRVDKMILDEGSQGIPSLAEMFLMRTGSPMTRHLE